MTDPRDPVDKTWLTTDRRPAYRGRHRLGPIGRLGRILDAAKDQLDRLAELAIGGSADD